MIVEIVTQVLDAATELLGALPTVFDNVVGLIYSNDALTNLGMIIVATAGFALAWAGIRFIFGFVNRLLSKTRAGR
jgi:hypothetical protein